MRLVITPWLPASKCSSDDATDGSSVTPLRFVSDDSARSTIDLSAYANRSRRAVGLMHTQTLIMVRAYENHRGAVRSDNYARGSTRRANLALL